MARSRLSVAPQYLEGERLRGLGHFPKFVDERQQRALVDDVIRTWHDHAEIPDDFGACKVMEKAAEFPSECVKMAARIAAERLLCGAPNRLQINWYDAGNGIEDHYDLAHIRDAAVLTLGSGCVIHFRPTMKDDICTRLLLRPGDLYVIRDHARELLHGILDTEADDFKGERHPRVGGRIALVFGTMRRVTERRPKAC